MRYEKEAEHGLAKGFDHFGCAEAIGVGLHHSPDLGGGDAILDVVPGRGGMFSLDNGRERRFLVRGRVFGDADLVDWGGRTAPVDGDQGR